MMADSGTDSFGGIRGGLVQAPRILRSVFLGEIRLRPFGCIRPRLAFLFVTGVPPVRELRQQLSHLDRQPGNSGQHFLRLSESGYLGLGLSGLRAELREPRPEDADIRPIIPEVRILGKALAVSGEGVVDP